MKEVLVHTGQHYDPLMSDVFFSELGIPHPDFHLGVGSGSHGAQTGQMLAAIESVLFKVAPDWVLVYGDTNSTLAGALAAAKLHVPVAHVEAGLRSFNRQMPEETNRVLTDHISTVLFAPTAVSVQNLQHEGIDPKAIHLVGDVMYDAALHYSDVADGQSRILSRLSLPLGGYVLATIHRAENTDNPARLKAILGGLSRVATDVPVVLPLHPRTRNVLERNALLHELKGLIVIDPVGYLDMVKLEKHAALIATDSGGVQKEAFFFEVPSVTFRDETEWVELVELGWNRLVKPLSPDAVVEGVRAGLTASLGVTCRPYGDGTASRRIVNIMMGQRLG